MQLGKSIFILIFSALMLSGCRLAITVTGDGTLTSASGLYDCDAGQNCELDVPEGPFTETFTATPSDGYRFTQWRGWASLCGGSPEPSCSVDLTPDATQVEGTVELNPVFSKAIVGSWLLEQGSGVVVLNFFADGGYILAETGCDADDATNPGGGFEHGKYEWDPQSEELSLLENTNDSLGDCGLQEIGGEPYTIEARAGENDLELIFDAEDRVVLSRIHPQSATDNTGTWVTEPGTVGAEVITFFGESQVMLASYCPENGRLGVELGTYTREGDNFVFTLDVDTNGECGIADSTQGNMGGPIKLQFMLGSMYIIEEDGWSLAPGVY